MRNRSVSQSVSQLFHGPTAPTPRSPLHPTGSQSDPRAPPLPPPHHAHRSTRPALNPIRGLRRSRSNVNRNTTVPRATRSRGLLNCRKCERQSLPAVRVFPVAFCTELLGRDCVRLSGWVVGRCGWGMCLSHPSSYVCCRRGVPLPPLPACISGAALDDAEHSLTDLDFCSARIRERSAPPPRALAPRGGPPPDHAVFASTRLLFRLGNGSLVGRGRTWDHSRSTSLQLGSHCL